MKKYSYITFLSDDSYIYGVMLLSESLKQVNSKYPLEILVTPNVNKPILNILDQLKLKYYIIDPIVNESISKFNNQAEPQMANTWQLCLSKFKIFEMEEFDKIVFLDADILVLKNLDHLFDYPHLTSALDGEYFNLWPNWPHFNSGILIVEPNKQEYENILQFTSTDALKLWKEKTCIADQEVLNLYYKDWPQKTDLHLNKYYDVFAPYIHEDDLEDIQNNCYFIHFVGRKPWRAFRKNASDTYSEYYYTLARKIITNCVSTLDWDSVRETIKIAIYSICKNEINKIEQFLSCFTKADYVCILDTGSTDGTWEYLQKSKQIYPNLIIEQKIIDPWRYDAARNYSLTLVPKDTTIFFMMDLDEIIKEDDWPKRIKAAWDPLFSRGAYTYHRQVDPTTDLPIHSFIEYRIHNNAWHYKGLVHEQLYKGAMRPIIYDECIKVPIAVWHYPTTINKEIYIQLCEEGVKEDPLNWLMHLQLAAEYEIHGIYDKAIQEYRIILAEADTISPIEQGRCYASLGRSLSLTGKKLEALSVFKKGIINVPNCGDNYYFAAEIQYQLNNFEAAYKLCQEGLAKASTDEWCTIISKRSYFPYLIMGLSQFYLGNHKEALTYITQAREKNNTEYINNVLTWIEKESNKG